MDCPNILGVECQEGELQPDWHDYATPGAFFEAHMRWKVTPGQHIGRYTQDSRIFGMSWDEAKAMALEEWRSYPIEEG